MRFVPVMAESSQAFRDYINLNFTYTSFVIKRKR